MGAGDVPAAADPRRHVKQSVRELAAYTLRHHQARVKLNQNESPYDAPGELKRRIAEKLAGRPWNRYPPFVPHDLTGAIAEFTGWPANGVLVANGSNELIQALLAAVVQPGVSIVIAEPTFTLYRLMTRVNGGAVAGVPLTRPDLGFDAEALIAAARESAAAALVLCTPNNPTGSALSREQIETIYDQTDSLVVLDQAYVEFGGYDAIPLLAGRPRLVILRTFSKAFGLAGLRAGYLLAHPLLAAEIAKAKLPYNLNFLTEIAAAEVMRGADSMRPRIEALKRERNRLLSELGAIAGIRVFPSQANFVLFRVEAGEANHRQVFDRLLADHGVLVRDVSAYPMLDGCLRVNAGTEEETSHFLGALRRVLAGS